MRKPKTKAEITKAAQKKAARKELTWRVTPMRKWREKAGLTQMKAAYALADQPYKIEISYASLGRYERGRQRPKDEIVDAIAKLYGTDAHSLLHRFPSKGSAEQPPEPAAMSAKDIVDLWDRSGPKGRELIADIARRVAQSGD